MVLRLSRRDGTSVLKQSGARGHVGQLQELLSASNQARPDLPFSRPGKGETRG